jgi:alcohol dehydrogenase YqhD (iron-dependent ADH family)
VPTKILFGRGKREKGRRGNKKIRRTGVLLHYGSKSAKKSGLLDRVEASLTEAGLSIVARRRGAESELSSSGRESSFAKKKPWTLFSPSAGASVIDSAKAIAGEWAARRWTSGGGSAFVKKPSRRTPSARLHPDNAARAARCLFNMVITNEDGMIKARLRQPKIRPKFSILNPELTNTLPSYQTAAAAPIS